MEERLICFYSSWAGFHVLHCSLCHGGGHNNKTMIIKRRRKTRLRLTAIVCSMKETLRSDFEVPDGLRKYGTIQRLTDEQDKTTIDAPRRLEGGVPMHLATGGFGAGAVNVRHAKYKRSTHTQNTHFSKRLEELHSLCGFYVAVPHRIKCEECERARVLRMPDKRCTSGRLGETDYLCGLASAAQNRKCKECGCLSEGG